MSLTAVVLNCTLSPSPATSSTDKLAQELLDAFARVPAAAAVLHLAGRDDVEPAYARRVRDRLAAPDLAGRVVVHGVLPRADVVALLTNATVFACPSIYEPLGIVNLEAMACETAVVASRVGGIPEVVADGETGLLVDLDPADPEDFERRLAGAVDSLVADPELPGELERTAAYEDVVMAVRHRELAAVGVQFHPESVLTQGGHRLLANWLEVCGDAEAVERSEGLSPLVHDAAHVAAHVTA